MTDTRLPFAALVVAHILFIWGGAGILGEFWLRLIFCTATETEFIGYFLSALWLAATLTPIVGILAVARGKFQNTYLLSLAFTLFVFWLIQFLVEIRVTWCDSL